MAYPQGKPLHFAVGRATESVPKYCGRPGSNTIPYLAWNVASQVWDVVGVPGGGGGDTSSLINDDPTDYRGAEAQARDSLNSDGTIPA